MVDLKKEGLIFVSGVGKLPSKTLSGKLYNVVCVGMAFKANDGEIKYAECTLKNPVINDFVTKLLIGHNIEEDAEILLKDVKERFWGVTRKAIIAAIKDAQRTYFQNKIKTKYKKE